MMDGPNSQILKYVKLPTNSRYKTYGLKNLQFVKYRKYIFPFLPSTSSNILAMNPDVSRCQIVLTRMIRRFCIKFKIGTFLEIIQTSIGLPQNLWYSRALANLPGDFPLGPICRISIKSLAPLRGHLHFHLSFLTHWLNEAWFGEHICAKMFGQLWLIGDCQCARPIVPVGHGKEKQTNRTNSPMREHWNNMHFLQY
jgi:hypothetical protein